MSKQLTTGVFKGFGIREHGMIRTTSFLGAAQQTAISYGGKVVSLEIKWKVVPMCPECLRRGQILFRCTECHGTGKLTKKKLARKSARLG